MILHFKITRLFAACVLITYFSVIYGTYVPDWQFTAHDRESSDYGKSFTVSLWFSNHILVNVIVELINFVCDWNVCEQHWRIVELRNFLCCWTKYEIISYYVSKLLFS